MKYLLLIAGIVAIVAWKFKPKRTDFLSETQRLISSLKKGRLEGIADLGDDDAIVEDKGFWIASNGLRGVMSRLRELTVIVRVLQIHVARKPELGKMARVIWRDAVLEVWFSLFSFPEAVLCSMWKELPHICARAAAACHVRATMRTQNLCFTEDTPECIGNLF